MRPLTTVEHITDLRQENKGTTELIRYRKLGEYLEDHPRYRK